MSGHHDEQTAEIPEADALEQRRDPVDEPHDPERTTTEPTPDGVEADPADVIEQGIDVPDDDEERDGDA
ncbi:hypothetical protein FVO59_14630 [Microbacterium esteraromaticum]|uniref:Uncharacterized protein n=1 Tax=Microbacterium esteraromaticum TaxID=57043 RepID=A0A7D8AAY4_9MICO|nr:hypothetical protein [Microbacterium esteraromaticum]QMU98280.1 hypothetical protein FVO59_14630 [Microbacterium esteraromaticum]